MVPSLRKAHRRIWIILAVLLPVFYVAAILVIPNEAKQEILYQDAGPEQIPQKEMEDSNQKQHR